MLKINHNAGFFSCCTVKLHCIVQCVNLYKKLPDTVDSSEQFELYKKQAEKDKDITYNFFEHHDDMKNIEIQIPIDYIHQHQLIEYSQLDYERIYPIIKKYFTPSSNINENVNKLENRYSLDVNNTLAVYYRGTDKKIETKISPFEDFYNQILDVKKKATEDLKILIQSDSAQFIDYIKAKNLDNIIIIDENRTSYLDKGIHNEHLNDDTNYDDIVNFLSTVIIMSKCKYIICGSGNCSIWIMFYRGNSKNVIQNLDGKMYSSVL